EGPFGRVPLHGERDASGVAARRIDQNSCDTTHGPSHLIVRELPDRELVDLEFLRRGVLGHVEQPKQPAGRVRAVASPKNQLGLGVSSGNDDADCGRRWASLVYTVYSSRMASLVRWHTSRIPAASFTL